MTSISPLPEDPEESGESPEEEEDDQPEVTLSVNNIDTESQPAIIISPPNSAKYRPRGGKNIERVQTPIDTISNNLALEESGSVANSRRNSWIDEEEEQVAKMEDPEPQINGDDLLRSRRKLKFLAFLTFFVPLFGFSVALISDCFHIIQEGHVGIYFRYGALLDTFASPGLNAKAPFLTTFETVAVRPTTDTLRPISTVTKDGISSIFNEIQVMSWVPQDKVVPMVKRYGKEFKRALIFDRISEELRKFCANHTVDQVYTELFLTISPHILAETRTSIERLSNKSVEILNLVVPKPDIPTDIAENYKQVKVQWTQQLVAVQEQKTEQIKKETESILAIKDAERLKDVLEIDLEKQLLMKEADKNISTINNMMVQASQENLADVEAYRKAKIAKANEKLYSPEYIQLHMAQSLSNNTKFYFSGETSPLGALLSKLIGTD